MYEWILYLKTYVYQKYMNLFTFEHINVYFKTYVEHSRKLPT